MSEASIIIPQLPTKDVARFWSYVDIKGPDECWLWKAAQPSVRYAVFQVGTIAYRSHRVAYVLHYGPLADPTLEVLHRCDTPRCNNPHHLFLGTNLDNRRDMWTKGRGPNGLKNGAYTHPEKVLRGDQHWMRHKPEAIARGAKINTAKLTEAQVIEMRTAIAAGTLTITAATQKYGIRRGTVWRIITRKNWGHI